MNWGVLYPYGNNCKEISKIIFDMIPGRVNY